jgi:hypothetical protein
VIITHRGDNDKKENGVVGMAAMKVSATALRTTLVGGGCFFVVFLPSIPSRL